MEILITGAGGFIGSALVQKLSKRDDIHVVGISHKKQNLDIECYTVDILDEIEMQKIFYNRKIDVVIHLAALTAHSQIVDNKYEALEINMRGTQNLLRYFNQYCRNALFLYASTGKVYGKTDGLPIDESMRTVPTNILGKSKLITERLVDFYALECNRYLTTRIFNIYGGNQKENFIIPTIIKQLKNGKCLRLGNITDKRDYLYIDDLVDALVDCIDNCKKFRNNDVVNIGSGEAYSVKDIVKMFEKELDCSIEIVTEENRMRYDEMSVEYCSNEKLKKLTGWRQQILMEEGIHKICVDKLLK